MKLTSRFQEALVFAFQLHASQTRKETNIPYVSHLMAVASLVLEFGGDEDQAIAALLHDSIEDQAEAFGGADRLRKHIKNMFGDRVLAMVEACTDAETIPKPPWRERKEAYIHHLQAVSNDALLVSASDKLHNARCILMDYRTIGEPLWSRFTGGREGTLWYYRELLKVFKGRNLQAPLLAEFERTVETLEHLASERTPDAVTV